MVTKELKKLVILSRKGKATAEQVWFEMVNNCQPTQSEFNKYVKGLLFTTSIMYWMLGKMGIWHKSPPNKVLQRTLRGKGSRKSAKPSRSRR